MDGAAARWIGPSWAPDVKIEWKKLGRRRFSARRLEGDDVTDTWKVRFATGDRPLWDADARLRAIGRPGKRGFRYRRG